MRKLFRNEDKLINETNKKYIQNIINIKFLKKNECLINNSQDNVNYTTQIFNLIRINKYQKTSEILEEKSENLTLELFYEGCQKTVAADLRISDPNLRGQSWENIIFSRQNQTKVANDQQVEATNGEQHHQLIQKQNGPSWRINKLI